MIDFDLDNPETYGQRDPDDMYRRVNELPEQLEDAWTIAGRVRLSDEYRNADSVVIAAMGGSAIGGSLVESFGIHDFPIPVTVWRNYGLPAFVDENSLVVVASYSGNTEETLSAAHEARKRRAKILAITTGGQVGKLAEEWQVPVVRFTYDAQPRATLGYLFTPLLRLFQDLRLLPNQEAAFAEALDTVKICRGAWKAESRTVENPAKQIARNLHGRQVVVYGAEYLSAVARRWKTQLNENSKTWAFYEEFPELDHNAIVGYEHPVGLNELVTVVVLSGTEYPDRIKRRVEVTARLMKEYGVSYRGVDATGDSRLDQMLSTIQLGDYVTYYLALLNNVDPTVIRPIDSLKKALSG